MDYLHVQVVAQWEPWPQLQGIMEGVQVECMVTLQKTAN